jgi:uncharacterized repeat protein (TIGR03806 family)
MRRGSKQPGPRMLRGWMAAVLVSSAGACVDDSGGGPTAPVLDLDLYPLPSLSDYRFFTGELDAQNPNDGVIPYTVNAPLWADHAEKGRFLVLPEGGKISWTEQDEWGFPTGTVFIKTFYFDRDRGPAEDLQIVETRLLVLGAQGDWDSHIYLWNDDQTEATHLKAGADVILSFVDEAGQPGEQLYLVPDQNTCESCHFRDDERVILGPTTAQLNTTWEIDGRVVNQIDWLREEGLFASDVPPAADLVAYPAPDGAAELDPRARAYLHGNCAHCHRPGGGGGSSGLKFTYDVEDPAQYGVCKVPAAAGPGAGGRRYSIVPGDPDASIVPFRMASENPEIKMPELPSLVPDDFGVRLVSEWIAAMEPIDCTTVEE